jgi:tetraspanin-13/31
MFCGGFVCSKNALIALNTFYIVVSVVLIGVGAMAKAASIIPSLSITGGIVAAGVFLLLVAFLGLFGASKHHQVFLFFYMIILFFVFLIQFFVAVACLAIDDNQIKDALSKGWKMTSNETICFAEKQFKCCGFDNELSPDCSPTSYKVCADSGGRPPCDKEIFNAAHDSLQAAGGIGLFFSFTEIVGIWLAMRYRNLKDPRANPNAFL